MKRMLLWAVLAAVAIVAIFQAEAAAVVPGDYAKSFTITFPGYSGSTTLTDFPVLVKISAARNGFDYSACQVSGGGDLRFADSSGNLLSSEVDTWNTSGESLVWVKVPSLDASTVITAYYGNANPPAVTASDVWSNGYVGVWHLNESLPPMVESSGVSTPFTQGQVAPTYAADGVIGKSVDFATKDDNSKQNRLIAADDADLDGFGDFTVEYWTYQGSFRNNEYACILSKRNASGNEDSWMVCQETSTDTKQYPHCYLRSSVDGTVRKSMSSERRPEANRWTYQAFTRVMDSGLQNWYFDGTSVRTTSDGNLTVSLPATASALKLGGGGSQNSFPGKIDEVRISSVARSADWVKASHDCVSVENFVVCTYEGQIDPEDYECSFDIAFTGYAGSTTLTDFPVLVRLSAALNGFDYSKCKVANGGDLRFADSSGNMLASEIDTWNESGESLVWVKVPSFNRNTVITACYGNATPPVAFPAAAVWANGYVGVWHLNESGRYMTDASRFDSPADSEKLQVHSSFPDAVMTGQAGLVGNATQFNVDSSTRKGALYTSDSRYLFSGSSGPFTIECWAYQDAHDLGPSYAEYLITEYDLTVWDSLWEVRTASGNPSGRVGLQFKDSTTATRHMFPSDNVPPRAEWNHFAVRHAVNHLEMRQNGLRTGYANSNLTLTNSPNATTLYVGNLHHSSAGAWPGLMDEVRISNVARSDDWLQATIDCVKKADFATCCATANDWKKYSRKFKVTFSGYDGSETLANFPVLVKVSESGISGFRYADCRKLNGGDLRFADAEGNLLASEVDTWNTNGVSLVWVKVPSLTAATMITAYYGWELAPIVDSSAVWANGYVGVWHLNESNSPMAESSGVSTPFTQGQVAPGYAADGVIGKSVDFATNDDNSTQNRLIAADDDDLDGFDDFTVEYWTCQESFRTSQYACILSKRNNSGRDNQESWMVCQNNNATTEQYPWFYLMPPEGIRSDLSSQKRPEAGQWTHQTITRVKDSGLVTWYFDGAERRHATKHTDTLFAGTAALKLGGGGGQYSFPGKIDEVRVSNVSRSADWVKASHDTVTESAFAVYGAAKENGRKGVIIFIR